MLLLARNAGLFALANAIRGRMRIYPQAIHKHPEIVDRTWLACCNSRY
jgi:hypothetical protein